MHNEILIPAQVFIEKVTPTIKDGKKILAREISGKLLDKFLIEMVEYTGVEPEIYENSKAECLLEITDAEFSLIDENENHKGGRQKGFIAVEYIGFCPTAHFFPEPDNNYMVTVVFYY